MREAELQRCAIQSWYPTFERYSIKTLFHPLPDSFVRYLLGQSSDGDDRRKPQPFFLPRTATGSDPLPRTTALTDPTSPLLNSDSDPDSDDPDSDNTPLPSFPDLESAVQRSISDLGGSVFPKLNWSAPKDAAWISFDGTLRCSSFPDLALLLRSSDAVSHDLCHAIPSCSDSSSPDSNSFYLAVRKWYPNLRPEMEFRCFVRRHHLLAVSQREITTFYPSLLERKLEIRTMIKGFFAEIVGPRFESEDYTFDVYVTQRGAVKVLDFNPWGAFTLPLMFDWEELEGEGFGNGEVELRIVESQCGVRPGLKTAVPYDYLDTGEGSGWDQFLKRVDEEQRKQASGSES